MRRPPRHRSRSLRAPSRLGMLTVLAALALGCPADPDPTPSWEVALDAGADVGALMSVWGPNSDEVYAVGGQPGANGFGVMFRFDGEDWAPVSLPTGTPMLNWVFGADGALFTVGEAGRVLRSLDGGENFEDISPPDVVDPLWGIWGASADELWAVGGDPFADAAALLRLRGGAGPTGELVWESFELPPLDRPGGSLFKVWGTSADQVWVVGDAGVILAWDGSSWRQETAGTTSDLISLWGTGPNEVAAIGGRANGTLARWDGQSWTSEVLPGLPGLNGLWMNARGEALVGGVFGVIASLPRGTSEYEVPDFDLNPLVVHAVFGFEDGARFAVGGSLDRSPPYLGVIAHLPAAD